MQIRIKKRRKEKLAKLRQKYTKSKGSQEKEKILQKVFRLVPWFSKEEFLASLKKKD